MGERKVLNKYYPPDFDPAKLPRGKRQQNNEMKVRMMLPMSVRCKTCGNFMYKGTKFNTRKEDVAGETYLGIQIFRFYYRCKQCAAEFCMKTDPKTSDYVMEEGASRNYEPWREVRQQHGTTSSSSCINSRAAAQLTTPLIRLEASADHSAWQAEHTHLGQVSSCAMGCCEPGCAPSSWRGSAPLAECTAVSWAACSLP
eukprot:GHRQ01010127.1.p1 GENE.GHRQ01010127.1~~GHRQ01010127.1.p1  ORF type:complete len:199 (+),score=59.83 GHRQ01010127.1:333-929(+)